MTEELRHGGFSSPRVFIALLYNLFFLKKGVFYIMRSFVGLTPNARQRANPLSPLGRVKNFKLS